MIVKHFCNKKKKRKENKEKKNENTFCHLQSLGLSRQVWFIRTPMYYAQTNTNNDNNNNKNVSLS